MRHREEERETALMLIPVIGLVYLVAWIIYHALTPPDPIPSDTTKEVSHETRS
jgi:hypothetical protein